MLLLTEKAKHCEKCTFKMHSVFMLQFPLLSCHNLRLRARLALFRATNTVYQQPVKHKLRCYISL